MILQLSSLSFVPCPCEATPEVLQLLEEALKMPERPNWEYWELRPDDALEH